MVPGCDGVEVTVTGNVLAVLEPQELFAVTEIVPPLEPTVTFIEVEVDEPLQPGGNVHVYEVAPEMEAIL